MRFWNFIPILMTVISCTTGFGIKTVNSALLYPNLSSGQAYSESYSWKTSERTFISKEVSFQSPSGKEVKLVNTSITFLYIPTGHRFAALIEKRKEDSEITLTYHGKRIDSYNYILVKFNPNDDIEKVIIESIAEEITQTDLYEKEKKIKSIIYMSMHSGNKVFIPEYDFFQVITDKKYQAISVLGNNEREIIPYIKHHDINTIKPMLESHDWKVYKNEMFNILYSPSISQSRIEHKSTIMVRETQQLQKMLDLETIEPITLFWFKDREEGFHYLSRPLGFAQPQYSMVFMHDKQSYTHETMHVLSYYALGENKNDFLNEGFSTFYDGNHRTILELYKQSNILSINMDLITEQLLSKSARDVNYALAGSFVGFIIQEYGIDSFRNMWGEQLNTKKDIEDILFDSVHHTYQEVIDKYIGYI